MGKNLCHRNGKLGWKYSREKIEKYEKIVRRRERRVQFLSKSVSLAIIRLNWSNMPSKLRVILNSFFP
jgi:hypothetical protein